MGAKSGYGLPFKSKYLLLLGIGTVSFIAIDRVLPGAGLAIAGSVALFLAIDTGAIYYLSGKLNDLRKEVSS